MSNKTSRFFAFTLNNPTGSQEEKIQDFAKSCKDLYHLIYSKEKGTQEETPHFQGALAFKPDKRKRCLQVKTLIGIDSLHIEPCKKHYTANVNYCKKPKNKEEETFKFVWQWPENFFNLPKSGNASISKPKKQTKNEVFELAKAGKFEEIEGCHWLTYEKQIKKIYADNVPVQKMFFDQGPGRNYFKTFNCLLFGPTGTGKSFRLDLIVEAINNWWFSWCTLKNINYKELTVYHKQQNKWWDGYLDEKIVIIEELEPSWVQMAQSKIKTWIDSNPFPCETKGGSISKIRPWFFLMTSNYDLEDLCGFGKDDYNPKVLFEPLQRRINCIKVNNFTQSINFPNYSMLFDYFWDISEVRLNYKKLSKEYSNKLELDEQYQLKLKKCSLNKNRFIDQGTVISDILNEVDEVATSSADRENQINEPILIESDIENNGRPDDKDYVYVDKTPGYEGQLQPPRKKHRN